MFSSQTTASFVAVMVILPGTCSTFSVALMSLPSDLTISVLRLRFFPFACCHAEVSAALVVYHIRKEMIRYTYPFKCVSPWSKLLSSVLLYRSAGLQRAFAVCQSVAYDAVDLRAGDGLLERVENGEVAGYRICTFLLSKGSIKITVQAWYHQTNRWTEFLLRIRMDLRAGARG